jgi:NTE family protein
LVPGTTAYQKISLEPFPPRSIKKVNCSPKSIVNTGPCFFPVFGIFSGCGVRAVHISPFYAGRGKKIFTCFLLSLCLWAGAEERPRVALVLGGGAAKGYAHIAVLELIEELGIPVDMIAGVSAGAIVGGLYCAGYSPAMMKEVLGGLDWPSFFQDRPVSRFEEELPGLPLALRLDGGAGPDWGKGYSTGEYAYLFFKTLTLKLPSYINFDELPVPFRAAAVEVPGGNVKLLRQGDLAEAIRASMGVPGVFEPFEIDGSGFVDGGVLNNLPIREIRELGFDIVIGVDLFPPPEVMDTSPLKIPGLMFDLYSSLMSKDQHSRADLILMPDVARFSLMDFDKASEIYTLAPEERERLKAALLPIREKTGASFHPPVAYGDRPPVIVQKLSIRSSPGSTGTPQISGAARSRIERDFNRRIKGKALEEEAFAALIGDIYGAGSYKFVTARIDARGEETCLELTLYPAETRKILLLAGADYAGVFSSRSSLSALSLRTALEFRGLTGEGSVLRLGSSIMDELSLGLFWLKPLGAAAFVSAQAEIIREQDVVVLGILNDEGKVNQDLSGRAALTLGFRFNRHNRLALSPEFVWAKSDNEPGRAAGLNLAYTYSSLNRQFFPTGGFRAEIGNTLRLPLPAADFLPAGMITADVRAAVPLTGSLSIAAAAFAGGRIDSPEAAFPPDIPFLTFTGYDRFFFPHVTSGERRAPHKAAASLSLQLEPWENLTLLGGQMVFLLSAAAGELMSGWDEFALRDLLWCASLGAGLRLNTRFGFCLRAGAGRDPAADSGRAVPFISFDIGALR